MTDRNRGQGQSKRNKWIGTEGLRQRDQDRATGTWGHRDRDRDRMTVKGSGTQIRTDGHGQKDRNCDIQTETGME